VREMTELRLQLLRRGYVPLPLKGKAPKISSWQNIEPDEAMIRGWERDYPGLTNTGIRTTECAVIDIDIMNAGAVNAVLRLLGNSHPLLKRIGRPPKAAVIYRTETPFQKRVHQYRSLDGVIHKIEILCDGQQLAAFGIHPDTKLPFTWNVSPAEVDRSSLPLLTEELADKFLHCADHSLTQLGWRVLTKPKTTCVRRPVSELDLPALHRAQINGILGKITVAAEGNKQSMLFWGVCKFADAVNEGVISKGEAISLATEAGLQAGLEPRRVTEVVNRVLR
jgi:hypothetical protein